MEIFICFFFIQSKRTGVRLLNFLTNNSWRSNRLTYPNDEKLESGWNQAGIQYQCVLFIVIKLLFQLNYVTLTLRFVSVISISYWQDKYFPWPAGLDKKRV